MQNVVVEVSGIFCGYGGDVVPGSGGLGAAFSVAGVAAEAVLAGDVVTLPGGESCLKRIAGEDGLVDGGFVAEVEAENAPGDLWLVGVREDVEGGREAGVRDHIRAHGGAVCAEGPVCGRLSVDAEDEQGMMRGEVGGGVVGVVGVVADGNDHGGGG